MLWNEKDTLFVNNNILKLRFCYMKTPSDTLQLFLRIYMCLRIS